MEEKVKILLDTDIGSDIDDAVCLAYLLANPGCELLGITTVSGEPVKRAMIASAICKAAGRKIPIYPGEANPLVIEQKQKTAPQAKALAKWSHDTSFPQRKATGFLKETIEANPGEIILLTIGPLTNIAELFRQYPGSAGLLKGVVVMGGDFKDKGIEWNIMLDPEAAEIIFKADLKAVRIIGLNVTEKLTMNKDEVREKFQKGTLKCVLDFSGSWFENNDKITFHDPLAAASVFDGTICGYEKGKLAVDVKDKGRTSLIRDDKGLHEAAMTVDAGRFFEHYFSMF